MVHVLSARTEGMGINAAARLYGGSKKSLYRWQERLSGVKQTLLLYALTHQCLSQVIEGDALYTRVRKNVAPDESTGWTIVLMDRATRFMWAMGCGRKDRQLLTQAIRLLCRVLKQTGDLTLLTDGERRSGNSLFEICHQVLRNGKRGRPKKTLRKGVKVRLKNKGAQAHKKGRKRPKDQAPFPEHSETIQTITTSNSRSWFVNLLYDHRSGQWEGHAILSAVFGSNFCHCTSQVVLGKASPSRHGGGACPLWESIWGVGSQS